MTTPMSISITVVLDCQLDWVKKHLGHWWGMPMGMPMRAFPERSPLQMWAAPPFGLGPGLNKREKGECQLNTRIPFSASGLPRCEQAAPAPAATAPSCSCGHVFPSWWTISSNWASELKSSHFYSKHFTLWDPACVKTGFTCAMV